MTETQTKPKKDRGPSGIIDDAAGTVTFGSAAYRLDDLSSDVVRHLALVGLRHTLVAGRVTFEELLSGTVSHRRTAATKAPPPWREAIAAAIVEKTKKSAAPVDLETARSHVAAMTREQRDQMRGDPIVAKHFQRLASGGVSPLDALLNGRAAPAAEAA